MALHGCLVIPPVKLDKADETPYEDTAQLAALAAGRASQDEVREILGAPDVQLDSGSVWVYRELSNEEWFFFAAIFGPAAPPVAATGGRYEKDIPHFLILYFDPESRLASWRVERLGEEYLSQPVRCDDGACAWWFSTTEADGSPTWEFTGIFSLFASETSDAEAKRFEPVRDKCHVYLYTTGLIPAEAWLDGQPAGWLLTKKQFLYWQVEPGEHRLFAQLVITVDEVLDSSRFDLRSKRIDCESGESYFFEPNYERKWLSADFRPMELIERSAREGQKAVKKRRLVLSNWEQSWGAETIRPMPAIELGVVELQTTTLSEFATFLGSSTARLDRRGMTAWIIDGPTWFDMFGIRNGLQLIDQQYVIFAYAGADNIVTEFEIRSISPILSRSVTVRSTGADGGDYDVTDRSFYCTADRYCIAPGGFVTQYASAVEDRKIKRERRRTNTCVVNAFDYFSGITWRLYVDGEFAAYLGYPGWPPGYVQWQLPDGQHTVTAQIATTVDAPSPFEDHAVGMSTSETVDLDCRRYRTFDIGLYIEDGQPDLRVRDDNAYESLIRRRKLILSTD